VTTTATHPSRRTVLRGLAASGLALTIAPTTAPAATAAGRRPPNIVFVSIDDLGWDELGCYGNTFNETPAIDQLARRGMRFTNAYAAAPVCSPTRAALVTGQYPARTGITDFLRQEPAPSNRFLSTDVPTLPDVLGPYGYTTGLIGKWHLTESYSGPYRDRPGNPYAHGFDEVVASEQLDIADGDYFHPYFFMPTLPARRTNEYLTDRIADEAVDFITRHRHEPFFVHVSNYAVHTRLAAKPDLVAKFEAKPGAEASPNRPVLAAMLQSIDEQVGRIAATLADLGLSENTLLMVTSDNGGPYRDANRPLRGGKGELYEGGIRVPLVAHWPGTIRAGVEDATLTSTIDVLPTALDLAGGKPDRRQFDGVSIAPVLTARGHGTTDEGGRGKDRVHREALFWLYPHYIGTTHPHAAVRHGQFKLVQYLRDGRTELYHLGHDPAETTDVSVRYVARARQLRALLEAHIAEMGTFPALPGAAYPVLELDEPFDTDLSRFSVLPVPATSHAGQVAVADGRLSVTSRSLTHLVFRSDVAPGSDEVAVVLDTGTFAGAGSQDTVLVGLARDADNYLLFRYHDGLHRVGWDLRVNGRQITVGGEPLRNLDGTVDLAGPDARYAFVLRGSSATAYADQGQGWEFLFTVDVGGAIDFSDPAVRSQYRYAASVRLDDGAITLDGITAHRA
jgi:arylsulfatase A-like enzyme